MFREGLGIAINLRDCSSGSIVCQSQGIGSFGEDRRHVGDWVVIALMRIEALDQLQFQWHIRDVADGKVIWHFAFLALPSTGTTLPNGHRKISKSKKVGQSVDTWCP